MKKGLACMLLLTACILVGCGNNGEKTITGDVNNNNSSQAADDGANKETQKENGKTSNGYSFKSGDVEIIIDGEAAPYLEAMGEPSTYFESPSCAFGDLDKVYTYPGFEMDTYSLEGVDYVSAIIFQDDSISTPEGICIGDLETKIEEVYGAPTAKEGNMYIYKKDEMKLCFLVVEGMVSSVQYLSLVLE